MYACAQNGRQTSLALGSNWLSRSSGLAAALMASVLLIPLTASATDCDPFNKQVSVDGGHTWFDADSLGSAPTTVVGGAVEYRFIVKNCFEDKVCINTKIKDRTLGITDALVGDGVVLPGQEIIVTKDDPGFENLDQPDRCDTPGDKKNVATETTEIEGFDIIETFQDPAWVKCEGGPMCGNGILDPGETCDPPGSVPDPDFPDNLCRESCTYCGDGEVNNGEECDFNDPNAPPSCTNDCMIPACGDGMVGPGETCDPPGSVPDPDFPDNLCRESCTYCGDGEVNNGEECDFNDPDDPLCRDDCTIPVCGDGIVDSDLGETCDPPGSVPDPDFPDNLCRPSCTYCGDGIPNNGEECDDPDDPNCTDDCMLVPCGLEVAKTCELPAPLPADDGKCAGKLQQYTMIWNGSGPITVTAGDGITNISQSSVDVGDEVTFSTDGSTNDTIVNISGAVSGESTFHVSCSDKDMDGATETNEDQGQVSPAGRDCGKDQGDGKGDSGINTWLLEGFVDDDGGVLDCTTGNGAGDTVCEYNAIPASCDFPDKPDVLTFKISGGDCSASDNDQKADKVTCEGGFIDPTQEVLVSVNGETPFTLQPGETFDVERSGDPEIELAQNGVVQFNKFHGSCSQPLQAGDRYGANELLLLDGLGLGTSVTYSYVVSNTGPGPVTDISVTDDQLGDIGTIALLEEGDSQTLTAMAFISETTTNVATVESLSDPTCRADSNPVVVDVLGPPPCDVGIRFYKLDDDKIKWKLTNNSPFGIATLQTLTLDFPDAFDVVEKVKLDGDIYKANDSNLVVGPGVTIGQGDWTEDKVDKRQIELGKTETLEIEFEEKDKNASLSDFDLVLTFEEGCQVTAPKAAQSDVAPAAGLGLACSATRLNPEDRFGLLLFMGALLLWSKRRRRTVV